MTMLRREVHPGSCGLVVQTIKSILRSSGSPNVWNHRHIPQKLSLAHIVRYIDGKPASSVGAGAINDLLTTLIQLTMAASGAVRTKKPPLDTVTNGGFFLCAALSWRPLSFIVPIEMRWPARQATP